MTALDPRTTLLGAMALRRAHFDLPWYDAQWLRQYRAALILIRAIRPALERDFVAALSPLHTDPGFRESRLDAPFDGEVLRRIRQTVRDLPGSLLEHHEVDSFGRHVVHDHPWFTELQHRIVPMACDLAGEPVEPTYNFLSLYTEMGVCPPHLDTPLSKWTLDLCIDQSEPWPIHFSPVVPWPDDGSHARDDWQARLLEAPGLGFRRWDLQPGQALWFSGSSQWHYRDRLATRADRPYCHLLFFHFMPAGTRAIAEPANWPRLFDCPALAAVVAPGTATPDPPPVPPVA